jgi:ATP-dependent RNA helicase RhlE
MKFETLQLAPELLRAVQAKGYEIATPIQEEAIPPILAGRDLVGCAQTGTGKTAAFALPTLQRILASIQASMQPRALPGGKPESPSDSTTTDANPRPEAGAERNRRPRNDRNRPSSNPAARRKTRVLVLAPTRELASQIAASFAAYGKFTALRHAIIYGGVSQVPQVKALQHGVDIAIATPGRLLDLMNQGHVDLNHVEVLILDEADQMLDMGFIPDLRRIIARVPKQRQTLMFSATMPDPIRKLAQEWLTNPASLQMAPVGEPADKVEQSVYFVEKASKVQLLEQWLQNTAVGRTLVFARTKHGADKIVKHLLRSKIRAAAIHGNKSQNARERTLEQFKSNRPPVLIATDIAARGLDIKEISHVVNYDLPEAPETYVHRIGRTGRAGLSGVAVSFCSREEVKHLRGIERLTRRSIEVGEGHGELTLAPPAAAPADSQRPPRSGGSGNRRSNNGNYGSNGNRGGQRSGASRSARPAASGGPGANKRKRYGTNGQNREGSGPSTTSTGNATASAPAATGSGRPPKRRRFKSGL